MSWWGWVPVLVPPSRVPHGPCPRSVPVSEPPLPTQGAAGETEARTLGPDPPAAFASPLRGDTLPQDQQPEAPGLLSGQGAGRVWVGVRAPFIMPSCLPSPPCCPQTSCGSAACRPTTRCCSMGMWRTVLAHPPPRASLSSVRRAGAGIGHLLPQTAPCPETTGAPVVSPVFFPQSLWLTSEHY